jgi:hypothetical protein
MKHTTIIIAVGLALAATLSAAPAQAQNARSFVSPTGSDAAACTLAAPCRTFAVAISKTNAGGEIDILGTAGYGSFTIDRPISIVNPGGVEAGIAVGSGGTGITINAGFGATVILRGLTIEGAGVGLYGINFTGSGSLEIIDCVVRNFTGSGIFVEPSNTTKLLISNTFVLDNGNAGIYLASQTISAVQVVTIDRVTVNNNNYGIYMDLPPGGSPEIVGTITNSIINNNTTAGLTVTRGLTVLHVKNVTIFGSTTGILLNAAAELYLSHSMILENGTGINIVAGFVYSAGNNDINANGTPVNGTLGSAPEL